MKSILKEWQNWRKVLPTSLAWAVGEEHSDFFMTRGRNVSHFKTTLGKIVDLHQRYNVR